jgi:plastocyanin
MSWRREVPPMLLRSLAIASTGVLLSAVPASAATTTVRLGDDYFRPGSTSVAQGSRVAWVNRGHSRHTVTTRRWSVVLDPGERHSRRVKRGFRYVCVYHGAMAGRIIVR